MNPTELNILIFFVFLFLILTEHLKTQDAFLTHLTWQKNPPFCHVRFMHLRRRNGASCIISVHKLRSVKRCCSDPWAHGATNRSFSGQKTVFFHEKWWAPTFPSRFFFFKLVFFPFAPEHPLQQKKRLLSHCLKLWSGNKHHHWSSSPPRIRVYKTSGFFPGNQPF